MAYNSNYSHVPWKDILVSYRLHVQPWSHKVIMQWRIPITKLKKQQEKSIGEEIGENFIPPIKFSVKVLTEAFADS